MHHMLIAYAFFTIILPLFAIHFLAISLAPRC